MIIISFISALILLESREIFQGLLSQPFVTAVFLVWAGYDQNFVLAAAAITHLIYLNHVPSGTTLAPEFPFSYFIVISSASHSFGYDPVSLMLAVFMIIMISLSTAYFIAFKRRFFERYRNKLLFFRGFPSPLTAVIFSLSIYFTYSFFVSAVLKLAGFWIIKLQLHNISIPYPDHLIILLCLIPAAYYGFKNFSVKK